MVTRLNLMRRTLTGELLRELERVGVVMAEELKVGWVVRTPGQGRGKRWWIRSIDGPVGAYGLMILEARLVEVHGVRSRARIRQLGFEPERTEKIHLRADELVVVDYRDWSEDDSTE